MVSPIIADGVLLLKRLFFLNHSENPGFCLIRCLALISRVVLEMAILKASVEV